MTRLRRASLSVLHFHAFCGYRTCVVSHRTITCSHAISTIRYSISSIHLFLCECVPSLYQQYTTHRSHHTETPHTAPLSVVHSLVTIYTHCPHTRAGRLGYDSSLVSSLSVSTRIYCHSCSSLVLVVSHNMIPPVVLEPRRPGELLIRKTPRRPRGLVLLVLLRRSLIYSIYIDRSHPRELDISRYWIVAIVTVRHVLGPLDCIIL